MKKKVAESLIPEIGKVSGWWDLWGMKLNSSKTKTMIARTRSRTMHPQSPPLTIERAVLKESNLLYCEWHLIPCIPNYPH